MKMNFKLDKECIRNMDQQTPEGRVLFQPMHHALLHLQPGRVCTIVLCWKCHMMEPRPGRPGINKTMAAAITFLIPPCSQESALGKLGLFLENLNMNKTTAERTSREADLHACRHRLASWTDLERSGGSNQHNQKSRLGGGLSSHCGPERPQLNCFLNRICFFFFQINSSTKKKKSSKNCSWFWFPTVPSMSVTLIWLKRKRKASFEAFCCSHCWKRWVIWTVWISPLETLPNSNHRGQQQQRWQPEEVQRGSGLPSPPLPPMVGSGGEENSDYLFVYGTLIH